MAGASLSVCYKRGSSLSVCKDHGSSLCVCYKRGSSLSACRTTLKGVDSLDESVHRLDVEVVGGLIHQQDMRPDDRDCQIWGRNVRQPKGANLSGSKRDPK